MMLIQLAFNQNVTPYHNIIHYVPLSIDHSCDALLQAQNHSFINHPALYALGIGKHV